MIGGQVLIPIRGVNNEKINLTQTQQPIKPGTFQKIKRAIALQKEIVLEDIVIDGFVYSSGGAITNIYIASDVEYFAYRAVRSTSTTTFVVSGLDIAYRLAQ